MRTVEDVNAVIAALQPLVTHSRKAQADIAAIELLRDDPAQAALVADVLTVVPLLTLSKLKTAIDAFLGEVEPKAALVHARELK